MDDELEGEDFDLDGFEVLAETAPPSQRWHWSFPAIHALGLAASVGHAAGSFFMSVARDVASHANYQMEQDERKRFAADADTEIEKILKGD
jgi:hypothetical protein